MPYVNESDICSECGTTIWGFGNTKDEAKNDLKDKMKDHKKKEHESG